MTASLPTRIVDGNRVAFAMVEGDGRRAVGARCAIQIRPHPSPPMIVEDWIGGYLSSGEFWQVGILQAAVGDAGSGPCQAFAWVTRTSSAFPASDDPLPLTYVPCTTGEGQFVAVDFRRTDAGTWVATVAGTQIGTALLDAVIDTVIVARETWSPEPTGWCGVFRGLRLELPDLVLPDFGSGPPLPAGAITSHTPGYLVLRDVGPGATEPNELRWGGEPR